LSSLAGAHDYLFPRVIELLKEKGAEDIVVFGGGIIPEEDILALKQIGVKAIFTPGTPIEEAVKWVRENIKPRK
jgi:methylmalonyl-CoA mutase C-terminal domain/subunit